MHLESAMGEFNLCPISIWLCWPNVNNMDIGFYRCHNLHNFMKNGMKTESKQTCLFSVQAFQWPELVKLVSHLLKKFKSHLTARWAALGPFSPIIIEIWLELKTYCKNIIHHKRLIKDLQKYPHTNER
jgi:hypothetical protein